MKTKKIYYEKMVEYCAMMEKHHLTRENSNNNTPSQHTFHQNCVCMYSILKQRYEKKVEENKRPFIETMIAKFDKKSFDNGLSPAGNSIAGTLNVCVTYLSYDSGIWVVPTFFGIVAGLFIAHASLTTLSNYINEKKESNVTILSEEQKKQLSHFECSIECVPFLLPCINPNTGYTYDWTFVSKLETDSSFVLFNQTPKDPYNPDQNISTDNLIVNAKVKILVDTCTEYPELFKEYSDLLARCPITGKKIEDPIILLDNGMVIDKKSLSVLQEEEGKKEEKKYIKNFWETTFIENQPPEKESPVQKTPIIVEKQDNKTIAFEKPDVVVNVGNITLGITSPPKKEKENKTVLEEPPNNIIMKKTQ